MILIQKLREYKITKYLVKYRVRLFTNLIICGLNCNQPPIFLHKSQCHSPN